MKICVVGCGAIGSLFAGHLARLEDVEVFAFDINQAHSDQIGKQGLRLSGEADFTSQMLATSDPKELPQCDFGIIVTKSMHTRPAIEATAHAFANGAVCSVQNGAGNEEILAEFVKFVIRGTTFPAGHLVEPGHVCYDIVGDTWIGPFEPSGTPLKLVEQLANPDYARTVGRS